MRWRACHDFCRSVERRADARPEPRRRQAAIAIRRYNAAMMAFDFHDVEFITV